MTDPATITNPDPAPLPLTGIRVVDVATVIASPYAACILGEFGADVLKVEHPIGGDVARRFGTPTKRGDTLTWLSEARNKKSVTIDLHRKEGVELFKGLVAQSDVAVRELPTGHARALGGRLGHTVGDQPAADHAAGLGLRPDRSLQGPAGVRPHRACRRRHRLSVRDAEGHAGHPRLDHAWATTCPASTAASAS